MNKKTLTEDEIVAALAAACDAAGGQRKWAVSRSISPQYVSDVLKKRRQPGDAICRALGYQRQVTYVRKDIWDQNKR